MEFQKEEKEEKERERESERERDKERERKPFPLVTLWSILPLLRKMSASSGRFSLTRACRSAERARGHADRKIKPHTCREREGKKNRERETETMGERERDGERGGGERGQKE